MMVKKKNQSNWRTKLPLILEICFWIPFSCLRFQLLWGANNNWGSNIWISEFNWLAERRWKEIYKGWRVSKNMRRAGAIYRAIIQIMWCHCHIVRVCLVHLLWEQVREGRSAVASYNNLLKIQHNSGFFDQAGYLNPTCFFFFFFVYLIEGNVLNYFLYRLPCN